MCVKASVKGRLAFCCGMEICGNSGVICGTWAAPNVEKVKVFLRDIPKEKRQPSYQYLTPPQLCWAWSRGYVGTDNAARMPLCRLLAGGIAAVTSLHETSNCGDAIGGRAAQVAKAV
jgi:hypothetical protein